MDYAHLMQADPELYASMARELERQRDHLELIASENFTSQAVMEAVGSHLTNKYAEGYPGARYYGGCAYVDEVERLAIERVTRLFGADHANVQPHSGSQANMAVYAALLQPGDRILGMNLSHGGHLTHGSKASLSGKYFEAHFYGVDPETETIDYEALARTAEEVRPKLIIAGASAYPRVIDFARFRDVADSVGAYLMVDMAHIGGLGRCGRAPEPRAVCRRRHLHDAQDAARPARCDHPLPRRACQEDRQRRLPRHAGRPAHARHRRQGGLLR